MLKTWSWKRFLKHSFLYTLFVVAIVGGFFGFYIFDRVLRVNDIQVSQTNRKVELFGIQGIKGSNMLFLNEKKVAADIKRFNPSIQSVKVSKYWPSTLQLEVKPYTPVASLQGDPGYYVLAKDATILEKQRQQKDRLPIITYYQKLPFANYQAGAKLDFKDILFTLRFLTVLQNAMLDVKTAQITGSHVITFKTADQEILTTTEKDGNTQQYQLEKIIKELRIQGKDFASLDVRFEKPMYVEREKK